MKTVNYSSKVVCAIILIVVGVTVALSSEEARAQDEWQNSYFMTSDGVRLHYIDAGLSPATDERESVIVFVPGWTMPAWIWEHQIQHFAKNNRVVAFDPRGQGESERPSFGYDHSRRARDIDELLDHLDIAPVILVGWSLGVLEVVKYLEAHGSEAIRGAVFVDWAMHYDDPSVFSERFVSLQTEREEWTRNFINAIYHSEQSAAYLDKVTEAALATPTNGAAIMIGNIILQGDTDLRPFMDVFDRPALFVYSSNGWSVAAAEDIRAGWPQFQVEVIEETSHTLFVDQPEEFNRVLAQFIHSIPE